MITMCIEKIALSLLSSTCAVICISINLLLWCFFHLLLLRHFFFVRVCSGFLFSFFFLLFLSLFTSRPFITFHLCHVVCLCPARSGHRLTFLSAQPFPAIWPSFIGLSGHRFSGSRWFGHCSSACPTTPVLLLYGRHHCLAIATSGHFICPTRPVTAIPATPAATVGSLAILVALRPILKPSSVSCSLSIPTICLFPGPCLSLRPLQPLSGYPDLSGQCPGIPVFCGYSGRFSAFTAHFSIIFLWRHFSFCLSVFVLPIMSVRSSVVQLLLFGRLTLWPSFLGSCLAIDLFIYYYY